MKTSISKFLSLTLGASLFFFSSCQRDASPVQDAAQFANQESRDIIKGNYIIQLSNNYAACTKSFGKTFTDREAKRAFSDANALQVAPKINNFLAQHKIASEKVSHIYMHAISGFSAELSDAQLQALKADPNVISIEKDAMMTLPNTEPKGAKEDRAQTTPCGISNAGGAGDGSTKGTWIWIIDTGIDLTHPDLNVLTTAPYATSKVGGTPADCYGHGTHVAGIAAAKNNTIGVVGVSAGAKVVPVKVFASCTSPTSPSSTIVSGVDHVAQYDISGDVVNMSVGGYYGSGCSASSPYKTAIDNLSNGGTWVAVAAGNDAANAANYQPACVNNTRVVTVASMTCAGAFASSYSNYETSAAGPIDYIATGSSVYSTYKGGSYGYMTGTSMATPHVAGILHQRNALPLSAGTILYGGVNYIKAKR